MVKGVPISERMRQHLRDRVFQGAVQHFLKTGYEETSLEALTMALGVDQSTLFNYFPNKEAFLLYFVEEEMACTHREAERIASMQLPAPQKLAHILGYLWTYLDENRELALLTARQLANLSDPDVERIAQRQRKYRQVLERIIRQGIQDGDFRSVDPKQTAAAVYDVIVAPFSNWLLYKERGVFESEPEARLDLCLRGIQKS